jgi:uncharacterized protein (DUF1800 family)
MDGQVQPAKAPTITRRTVLAAAAAGGAGVAAVRLLGPSALARGQVPITGGQANALGLDWVSPLDAEPAKVAHLLRRTSFGYTQAELDSAIRDGYARTVDRLVETKPAEPPPFPGGDTASQAQPLRIGDLQAWWLDWMLATPTPLAERLTLFWHSHFTSDFRKVGPQSPYIYWQNLTWRRMALGELRDMLYQVTIDPAMLDYLDLATSNPRNPNENYARELMELFTMGAAHFTEDDVKAAARALVGWRVPRTEAMVKAQIEQATKRTGSPPPRVPQADTSRVGVLERGRGPAGAYAFLGKTRQWDTQSVIDRILEQDATAPFIARKLAVQFVSPSPGDAYVASLADTFRTSGYSVKALMRAILTSPEFTAPTAYRSLIKSPVEYMLSAAKALGNPGLTRFIAGSGTGMGMTLFDPPSVGGWPNNESWVSSNAMLARANYVTAAVQQTRRLPPSARAHEVHLDSVLSGQTLKLLNEANDEKRRWTYLLAAPEFQLK